MNTHDRRIHNDSSVSEMPKEEFKDYYSLLEIEVESDERTINKAYRLLAKKYHPDKNKGNKNASLLFSIVMMV